MSRRLAWHWHHRHNRSRLFRDAGSWIADAATVALIIATFFLVLTVP